jgi:hypothetical protein
MTHFAPGVKMYDKRMTEVELRQRLLELIIESVGVKASEVLPDKDIEHDLGCTGDDFHELMDAYSDRFNVDMSGYLWYFHTHDETMATLNLMPGNPPSKQVERIPVTLNLMVDKALLGRWDLKYPPHVLQSRYTPAERVMGWLLLGILIFFIVWSFF